jgi:hypothetical protein
MDEGHSVTARIKVQNKQGDDPVRVTFLPDYAHGRNAEWASATPALLLDMTMRREVADQFEPGEAIELTFRRNPDQPVPGQAEIPEQD